MPIYRGPDGKIIEERTRKVNQEDQDAATEKLASKSPNPASTQDTSTGSASSEAKTRKVSSASKAASETTADSRVSSSFSPEEAKTRLFKPDSQVTDKSAGTTASDVISDPAVGWLAVISGPGKGNVMQLGYGANAIGRGQNDRIKVDFGDDMISRGGHAIITYDPRGRQFYIQHGGGSNLTYLGDKPVLVPIELAPRSRIQIGNTTLYFQPLCDQDFDWQDMQGQS